MPKLSLDGRKKREQEQKRKEHARKLQQVGAMSIKYFKLSPNIEVSDYEEFIKFVLEELARYDYEKINRVS